jgi:hypothetical protein
MRSRPRPGWRRWKMLVFGAAVAAALAAAACSSTAPNAASNASKPTLVSATAPAAQVPTTRPTSPSATATATARALPAATASQSNTLPTSPAPVANSQSAPTAESATPDRPFGPRTKDSGCAVHDRFPDSPCTPGAIFPDMTAEPLMSAGLQFVGSERTSGAEPRGVPRIRHRRTDDGGIRGRSLFAA